MKVKELYDSLKRRIEGIPDCYKEQELNKEVVVEIAKPSVGPRASVKAKYAGFGMDWEANRFAITPEVALTLKSEKEEIWDMAKDLIMWIATKPVKKDSYEIRTAKRILDKNGTEYMKYQKILHGE